MLNATEKIVVSRIGLENYRRALGILVVHQNIDFITLKCRLLARHADTGDLRLLGLGFEILQINQNILLNGIQISQHFFHAGIFLTQRIEAVAQT